MNLPTRPEMALQGMPLLTGPWLCRWNWCHRRLFVKETSKISGSSGTTHLRLISLSDLACQRPPGRRLTRLILRRSAAIMQHINGICWMNVLNKRIGCQHASPRLRHALRPLMGLPVLVALGLGTLPARALPNASVQLFRINGDGVKPMPAISDALDRVQLQQDALAQASQVSPAPAPVPAAGEGAGAGAGAGAAAPAAAVAAPVAAAGLSPLVIIGAVVLVGAGVAAAAGAFSGGGGTSASSQ